MDLPLFTIRPVAAADLDLVCCHREWMFRASGRPDHLIAAMGEPFREWLAPRIADGRYFGWIAQSAGQAVGGLGMMEIDWPPHPFHPASDRRGYILNVFVEPEHRGQGIARNLMAEARDEAKRRGLAFAVLHATEQGRPLYERLGWAQTAEMGLVID